MLAVEKRITSPLMEPTTIEKIVEVDKHIGQFEFILQINVCVNMPLLLQGVL